MEGDYLVKTKTSLCEEISEIRSEGKEQEEVSDELSVTRAEVSLQPIKITLKSRRLQEEPETPNKINSAPVENQQKLRFVDEASIREEESVTNRVKAAPNYQRAVRSRSQGNFRRKSPQSGTSYRRWSSQRRFSRHTSVLQSEDIDDIIINSNVGNQNRTCFQLVPRRIHGLFIALLTLICSIIGFLGSVTFLFRNYVIFEVHRKPVHCNGILFNYQVYQEKYANLTNCTFVQSIIFLLSPNVDKKLLREENLSDNLYLHYGYLWCILSISLIYLWAGVCLWSGIWYNQRRCLLPWLLTTGVAVSFFIMISVWAVISSEGWDKIVTLVPVGLAIIFLYWWSLVNELLEELHDDKKALYKEYFEAGISEVCGGMTTTANEPLREESGGTGCQSAKNSESGSGCQTNGKQITCYIRPDQTTV